MIVFKFVLSSLYWCVWFFNYSFYRLFYSNTKTTSKPKIISVGNLSVGGTGKTPFVCYISSLLSQLNVKHSVVSRGYKKLSSKNILVSDGNKILSTPSESGDEPYMLSTLLPGVPVFSGNKKKCINKSRHYFNYSCCIVDDGFQSYYIKNKLDIVLVDTSVNITKLKLLPLGLLREPFYQIKRSDVVVLTKTNIADVNNLTLIKKLVLKHTKNNNCLVLESSYLSVVWRYALSEEKKKINKKTKENIVLVSGIGSPDSFDKTASLHFSSIKKHLVFSDHHSYSKKDIEHIKREVFSSKSLGIATTRKDFVKIQFLTKVFPVFVVEVCHDLKNSFLLETFLKNSLFNKK